MVEREENGFSFLSTRRLIFFFCTTDIRLKQLCRVEDTEM